jgi:hypothetical protein
VTENFCPDLPWPHTMVRTPSLDRRRLLAAGATTLLAGVAGCNDSSGTEPVDPGEPISQAPGNTSVLVRADTALLDHDGTERLLEAYGGGRTGSDEGSDGPGLVAEFEGRTGLEAESADVIVVFADEPRGEFAAYVVEGEWTESTVVESIESATDLEYEARDHEGGTVYEPTGGDEADYLGFVAEGRYAIGSVGAVEAAIETARADRASASGALVNAFEDAGEADAEGTTYVTAATDDPRAYLPSEDSERVPDIVSLDVYEKANVATVSYAAAESAVAIDAEMRTDDRSDARGIADLTVAARSFLRNDVDDAAVAEELGKIEIDQEESVVTLRYRSDVEGAATLAGYL